MHSKIELGRVFASDSFMQVDPAAADMQYEQFTPSSDVDMHALSDFCDSQIPEAEKATDKIADRTRMNRENEPMILILFFWN